MEQREKLDKLGKKILDQSRTDLLLSMPYLKSALCSLSDCMDLTTSSVGTDASYIRFNPHYLFNLFLEEPQKMLRTMVHMLLHCLFQHMYFAKKYENQRLWNLCCDIVTESVTDSIECRAIYRISSDYRLNWYQRLNKDIGTLTAQRLYDYFNSDKAIDVDEDEFLHLEREFLFDDHSFWERLSDEKNNSDNDEKPPFFPFSPTSGDNKKDNENDTSTHQNTPMENTLTPIRMSKEDWDKTSRIVKAEIETLGNNKSLETGTIISTLTATLKSRTNWRKFLSRFSTVREDTIIDLDSFDYGLYNFGMSLYGNMPLIEENEFCEAPRLEQLAIVIDTSASCQGKLVQHFLDETAAILESKNTFTHKSEIHIIECDDQIQKDIVLHSASEMKNYSKNFINAGGYGTDFRPAFNYIDALVKEKKLPHLRGILYFTDGYGIFPENPPQNKADIAFVFWKEEDYDASNVPDWAMKLIID